MKRKLPYDDVFFDQGLQGWLVDYARKNHWKVQAWIGLDDLIQEGMVAYCICKMRYAERVENKKHFMSLFKRIFSGMIIDMAKRRTNLADLGLAEVCISQITRPEAADQDQYALELLGGGVAGDAEMEMTIAKASAEVRALINLIQSGRLATLDNGRLANGHFGPKMLRNGMRRETTNEFYNRMLGTEGVDFEGQLRDLLF